MHSTYDHEFIFADGFQVNPTSARKIHLRRLNDVLQLSIQRRETERAKRAWMILSRCREANWMTLWTTAILILSYEHSAEAGPSAPRGNDKAEFLRIMMLQYPYDRENILRELVFSLVNDARYQDALSELELYLPTFPYQDNPVLHTLAGCISMFLAQSKKGSATTYNHTYLRDAEAHFRRAIALNADETLVSSYMDKIHDIMNGTLVPAADHELEEEYSMDIDRHQARQKRTRVISGG